MAKQNVAPEHHTDELAMLRQQLEEIQKRLEELSAADAKAQDIPSTASTLGAQEVSHQSEEHKAEIAADTLELHGDDIDAAASSNDTRSTAQPVEAVVCGDANSEGVQTSQYSAAGQPSAKSVGYEPYVPPSKGAQHPHTEAASEVSTSSPAYKQQSHSTSQQATTQKSDEAQSGHAYQQASQAQNPYEGAYAGQQVPFGQAGPQQQYYQQAQQAYYGYGVQQNNAYQASLTHSKDHVAAALLAIFLGVFGIHKFYLGYHTAGFIMLGVAILGSLFTFGLAAAVMWLIGVIEGVTYLVKDQVEFEQIYVFKKREWF